MALAEDRKSLGGLHMDCMTKASDFEAETTSRGEELKALAFAKKAVVENTAGATSQQYSFLHAKIKGMIGDMIAKLEQEAAEAAELKEWCDKEIAESTAKKDDSQALFDKLSTKLDTASAQSKKLKEEVATLQRELADLAKSSAEMDRIRAEEKAAFDTNHPEMEQGLKGIKIALKILNEYYAKAGKSHSSSDGAGGGIVGMLEVIESDFTKTITEMVAAEQLAADTAEKETKENAVEKTTKSQA